MSNNNASANSTSETPSRLFHLLDSIGVVIFTVLILNIIVEIIITTIAIFTVQSYLNELMNFSQIVIIGIILVIVIPAPLSFGYEWIGSRIFKWDEDKKLIHFGISYIILSSILFILSVLLVYFMCIPSYSLLQDPFQLGNETILGIVFFLWWFFGFISSAIGLALLTIWVFFSKYSK